MYQGLKSGETENFIPDLPLRNTFTMFNTPGMREDICNEDNRVPKKDLWSVNEPDSGEQVLKCS